MEVILDTKLEQRFLAKFFFEYYTSQIKVSLLNKHTLFSTFDKNKIYKFVERYRKFRSRSSHSADSFFFFFART